MFKLYTYFRSSASYRVRIALNLKGLAYEAIPVHLVRDGGQQHAAGFSTLNPSELVPVLQHDDAALPQSLAIIEYLEERHPQPALLPTDAVGRARVRALAQYIACDIHPLNNLRVLRYLEQQLGLDAEARQAWYRHWVETGFTALERMLAESPQTGRFCHGDTPGTADCCLVPQVFNAERFGVAMAPYPTIRTIAEHCMTLEPFRLAAPPAQPDAE
ncbi:maleylacetoacetate isomerase [Thauera sp. SDU_THAU2]|uniref:maleylacetoacetate isomerase n=1 Tax=Thauera sp. SDU_THAU2 TaxID=3136633 RepID=UPI00311E9369